MMDIHVGSVFILRDVSLLLLLLISYFLCRIEFIFYWTKWYTLQTLWLSLSSSLQMFFFNITLHNVVNVMFLHLRLSIILVSKNLHCIPIYGSDLMHVFLKENWPLVKHFVFHTYNMSLSRFHEWLIVNFFV